MKEWAGGNLDLDAIVQAREFVRGDVEGALHLRAFMMAMQLAGSSHKKGAAAKTGTSKRQHPTDTWCKFHRLFYQEEAGHTLDGSKGTCNAGNAAAKKNGQ